MNTGNYPGWQERGQSETTRLSAVQRSQVHADTSHPTIQRTSPKGRLAEWSETHPMTTLLLAVVAVFGAFIAVFS